MEILYAVKKGVAYLPGGGVLSLTMGMQMALPATESLGPTSMPAVYQRLKQWWQAAVIAHGIERFKAQGASPTARSRRPSEEQATKIKAALEARPTAEQDKVYGRLLRLQADFAVQDPADLECLITRDHQNPPRGGGWEMLTSCKLQDGRRVAVWIRPRQEEAA